MLITRPFRVITRPCRVSGAHKARPPLAVFINGLGHGCLRDAKRGVSNARVVDFKLTADEAAQALRRSRNFLQKVPELDKGANPPRAAFLPFYVFDTTATLRFTATLGFDHWVNEWDALARAYRRVRRTRWEQLGDVHTVELRYGDDRPEISYVYASFEYGRPYVQAVKIPNAVKESAPFNAAHFANRNRELDTFDMYRTFAFDLVTTRARKELEADAQKLLLDTYKAHRIANFQGELLLSNTKCVPLYLPAYIFENAKEGAKSIVSGVTGSVGGEKVYSESRVSWAAAGTMAAYHALWHIADHGLQNFGKLFGFWFFVSVWVASSLASVWARSYPRLRAAMREHERMAEKEINKMFSSRAQSEDFTKESYDFHQRQRQAYEQARQQQYERAREWAYRGGQQYQYGQQQQQRPREPGAAPGDPLGYYKALGVERNATTDDIKKAFRKQAMAKHPDMVPAGKKDEATKAFQKLTDAYQVLRDPKKRRQYDMGMV